MARDEGTRAVLVTESGPVKVETLMSKRVRLHCARNLLSGRLTVFE